MAEPIFLKLKHLGDTVIDYIDLFDEGVYGADKLFLRGRYTSFEEVKSAIEECLALGSPTEDPASESNKLAFNRFNQPDKVFFIPDLNDKYAMKAQFMLQFAIRVRLYDNFAYIHFGIPWARKWDVVNDCPNEKYPFGKYTKGQTFNVEDLQILRYSWISEEDAETILKMIGLSNPIPLPVSETGKLQVVINNTTATISDATIELDSIDKVLKKIKSIQDEIDSILTEVPSTSLQEKHEEQKTEYSTHSSTLENYKQTLQSSQSTLQSNKTQFDKGVSQTEFDSFLKSINQSLEDVKKLATDADELKENVNELYAKVVELKKLCDERKAMKDKIEALKQDASSLENKITQNKTITQELETTITGANGKLSQHDGKGLPLKAALDTISSEKDAISSNTTDIESSKTEIDGEISQIEQDFTSDIDFSEIEKSMQSTSTKISSASSESDKAKAQLDNLQKQAREIDSTIDEMIVVIDSLESVAGDLGNDDASLHENLEKVEEFKTTISSLEMTLVTKENPDEAKDKLDKLKESVNSLEEKLTKKDTDVAMADKQGDSIDDSLANFDASTKDQIQSDLTAFETVVGEITEFIEGTDTEVADIEAQIEAVKEEINQLNDLYPSMGGASADEGTTVVSTIAKSQKQDVDYDIVTNIDASEKEIEPKTISGGQVLADGTVTPSQMVAYVVSGFWERPSDEVEKYEVQFAGEEKWGKSNVDTQGNKKGARVNMHFGESNPRSGEITLKWKTAEDKLVSTVNIVMNFTGVILSTYTVAAKSLNVEGTKLSLKFDKKIPNKMIVNVVAEGTESPIQFTADGFKDTFELSSTASADSTYKVTSIENDFLNVTGLPVQYAPSNE